MAGGGTNPGSNDIIDHVLNCASGASPCTGTSVGVTVGVTTWLDEDSQTPSYAGVFATGLKSSVPMGQDMYFFLMLRIWHKYRNHAGRNPFRR